MVRAAGEVGGSALATVRADHVGALLEMAAAAAGPPPGAREAAARGAHAIGGAQGMGPAEPTDLCSSPASSAGKEEPC